MSNGFTKFLLLASFTAIATLAIAQQKSKPSRSPTPDKGKVATAEEPDFTRFRVVTDEGILAVYDADEEWDGRDGPASQLAYWNDFATQQLFFFDQLLFNADDVLQSVAAMQRDLQIDPAQMLSEKPELHPLPEITMPGQWRLARIEAVMAVMAGEESPPNVGAVSGLNDSDVPCDFPPLASLPEGPLPTPMRGSSAFTLFTLARGGSGCLPGGGGGGGGDDDDDPPCVSCSCNPACCGDPCCGDPCCGDPCCGDPCCGDPCCNDRCCQGSSCCESPDPCCDTSDRCCGNPDPCCNPDNPDCEECTVACCNSNDPCCNDPNPCCRNLSPCDPECGDPCLCADCDDGDPCTIDECHQGACSYGPTCLAPLNCCPGSGTCCPTDRTCCDGVCCQDSTHCGDPVAATCCNDACCEGACCDDECCSPAESCTSCGCCEGSCCNGSCCNGNCVDGTLCCDDGDPCTLDEAICGDELCTFKVCTFPPICDDDNPCTSNYCTFDGCGLTTCDYPDAAECTACPNGSCIDGECVLIVDLDFESVADDKEENPGAFVSTWNEEGELLPGLTLTAGPGLTGTVTFEVTGGKGGIQLYQDAQGTSVLPLFNQTLLVSQLPKTFYVKGSVVSSSARDIEFKLIYDGPETECDDTVKLTVLELKLKSLTFTTDHDLLRDTNLTDFRPDGPGDPLPDLFHEPKWEADREPVAFPISHTMKQNVGIDAKIELLPPGSNPPKFFLSTNGPPGFHFQQDISLSGGDTTVSLTSTDQLEERIQKIEDSVEWTLKLSGRTFLRRFTGPMTTYVTVGTPRDPTVPQHVVTWARMARAVEEASFAGSTDSHAIVEDVVWNAGEYDLDATPSNTWVVPETGGDCQTIIRFAGKVAKMINIPGTFEHRNIYAIESAPDVAIEGLPSDGGLGGPVRWHPLNPSWYLALVDGEGGCNAFEAAAKFTACKATRYYPGGVPGKVFEQKDDVLRVFESLSWVSNSCSIHEQAVYFYPEPIYSPLPPPCP